MMADAYDGIDREADDADRARFHNRLRILMNLPDDAFPPELREDNPTSAALWAARRSARLLAFIAAPDAVAKSIWRALRKRERGDG